MRVEQFTALNEAHIAQLCELLIDCVNAGASVGFMAPLGRERAERFWRGIAQQVASSQRRIVVALGDTNNIIGSAQLVIDQPDNQPHRADVSKVLVLQRARRQGVGEALMRAIEAVALRDGKSVLVLDTVTKSNAYRLYQRLGWQVVGDVPQYALMPDGTWCSTTYFTKMLPIREIRPLDPFSAEAAVLLQGSTDYAISLYPPESCYMIEPQELAAEGTLFLGAWWMGKCEGCAAIKRMTDDGVYAEIKRVFVPNQFRGKGHAMALMQALHTHARKLGLHSLRLETGPANREALALYKKLGYRSCERFGSYRPDPLSVFMALELDPA